MCSTFKTVIFTGDNVVIPGHETPCPATVVVNEATGRITHVIPKRLTVEDLDSHDPGWPGWRNGQDVECVDAGNNFILPGLVDAHVHLNEPGRTDWEGFCTGTRAAASGGVTTVVDMPLNSIPPTTTVDNLDIKRQAARGQCWTDVAFWGGVIPGNQPHLIPLIKAGVKGFKCFLIESGVEEFPCVTEQDLKDSMKELETESAVLLFHAELDNSPSHEQGLPLPNVPDDAKTLYSTFLDSRPQRLETDAITLITSLQRTSPSLRCHIVHLSASSALPIIRAARESGLNLTVETCFHYLCLSSEKIPPGRPQFKCCPPIREGANRELLWEALKDGVIDFVVSDHSPCITSLKKMEDGDIMGAWGGISALGLGLNLLWTEGRKRGVSVQQIVNWLSVNTAKHAGLDELKGQLKCGYHGDLIIWNPSVKWTITKDSLQFKNKLSAYEGKTVYGRVEKTFLRGRMVYEMKDNVPVFGDPDGELI